MFLLFSIWELSSRIYFHHSMANVVHTRTWKITDAFCALLKFILIEVASLDFCPVHATDIFIKQNRTTVTFAFCWAIVPPFFFHLIWVVANTFIAIYQIWLDVYFNRQMLVQFWKTHDFTNFTISRGYFKIELDWVSSFVFCTWFSCIERIRLLIYSWKNSWTFPLFQHQRWLELSRLKIHKEQNRGNISHRFFW